MRQFWTVFKFEFGAFIKSKGFVGITLGVAVVIGILLSIPRITALFESGEKPGGPAPDAKPFYISAATQAEAEAALPYLSPVLTGRNIKAEALDDKRLSELVSKGEAEGAIYLDTPLTFRYFVRNSSMYDETQYAVTAALQSKFRADRLAALGVSASDAAEIMSAPVAATVVETGTSQQETFFYTYAFIFLLYMAVMIYGQFIAVGVASEKGSRAMELLVTSVRPTNLMFGKVIGVGLAGLLQLAVIVGSALVFYTLNADVWQGNEIVRTLFNIPLHLFFFILLFFLLGYFLYAFVYGALGSLASRMEDVNTTVLPVTFIIIAVFMIVMFSMSSGSVDSLLMIVCSYIPFSAPFALFTRVAMTGMAAWEIVLAVAVLFAFTVGIGYLAAGIYRVGVLLYGKPPKIGEIFRQIKRSKAGSEEMK